MSNKHIPAISDDKFDSYNPFTILKDNSIHKYVEYVRSKSINYVAEKSISKILLNGSTVVFLPESLNAVYDNIVDWSYKYKEAQIIRDLLKYSYYKPNKFENAIVCLLITIGYTSFSSVLQKLHSNRGYLKLNDFYYLFRGIKKGIKEKSLMEGVIEFGKKDDDEYYSMLSYFPKNISSAFFVLLFHLDYYKIADHTKLYSYFEDNSFPWYNEHNSEAKTEIQNILNYTFPKRIDKVGGEKFRYIYRDFDQYIKYLSVEFNQIEALINSLDLILKYKKHLYWGVFDSSTVEDREKYYNKP